MGLAACDDDDPTDTGNDTTAPGISSVTAVDSTHFNARFSEMLDRTSAETESNYAVTTTAAPQTPLTIVNASLLNDSRTVVITTSAMTSTGYTLTVANLADRNGNTMSSPVERTFSGSDDPDETAPEIVMAAPSRNETNVVTTAPIEIQFSEPVPSDVFNAAFTLTTNNGVEVPVLVTSTDGVLYTVQPTAPLVEQSEYTVTISGLADNSGNPMAADEWTFRTGTTAAVTSVR
jgi:hypothetical protein